MLAVTARITKGKADGYGNYKIYIRITARITATARITVTEVII